MSGRRRPTERHRFLAVIYLRVSTDEQAERGMSLDAQLLETQRFSATHDYTIGAIYTERGCSGRDEHRPEFQRMLADITAPDSRVGTIIVVHYSRFFRDVERSAVYRAKLQRNGIQVLATQQPVGAGPEASLMTTIFAALDQYESENIGRRTRAGMLQTVRAGFFVGSQPPLGFRIVTVVGPNGAEKKRLEFDPEEAVTVREMFALYLTRGATSVAAELNGRGLLYRGKLWDRDRVLRVISDESLIGTYWWGKTDSRTGRERPREEWVSIPVEPIIDRDLFDRVQAERECRDPVRNPGREASSPLLLAGLVACAQCGARYQLQTAGKHRADGSRYEYVQCSAARRRGVGAVGSCPGFPVPVDALDAAVTEHLLSAAFSPERCPALLHDLVEREGVLRSRIGAERKQWERERSDLERRRARLVETIETADDAPAGLVERIAEIEQRLREVRERLDRIVVLHDAPPWLDDPATMEAFRARLIEAVRGRPEILRAYLHGFACAISVGTEGVTITSATADVTAAKTATTPALPARKTGS